MSNTRNYAEALFSLSEQEGVTEAVHDDVLLSQSILIKTPEYPRLLDSPNIPKEERLSMIDASFGSMHEYFVSLVKLLSEARLSHLLPQILSDFVELYNSSRGILEVLAITAVPMTEAQISALEQKINIMTAKRALVKNEVQDSLIGGMKLRFSGKQIDGSIKGRLDDFEARLAEIII